MIYFLIPIFNEFDNLKELSSNLHNLKLSDSVHYIFSDDGSTDKSLELLREEFSNDKFNIISDGKNYGPGHAFNIGMNWILSQELNINDIVITLESDSTGDYSLIPKMIEINKLGYDLILASVYAQGGGFDKTSVFRKTISFFANMFFRIVFDIKVLTLSSFYRCYSVDLLQKLQKEYGNKIIEESGFICMLEILLKAIKIKANVIELPMKLKSGNRVGKSKMKVLNTTISYLKFLVKYKLK